MATIEIPDNWLESMGLSAEQAKDYLLSYPVMAEICLFHMTSTFIRTPPNSILGHAHVILGGIDGPVTERQSQDLQLIINSAEELLERLTHFINMVSSIFKRHTIYLSEIDAKEVVTSAVMAAAQNGRFEISYKIPDSTLIIQTDQSLFERLLSGMLEITKRIRPTDEGTISVFLQQTEMRFKISIKVEQDAEYPFELSSDNPFAYMAQAFAEELKGSFTIFQQENSWQVSAELPIRYE